jgi:hypothetical protein
METNLKRQFFHLSSLLNKLNSNDLTKGVGVILPLTFLSATVCQMPKAALATHLRTLRNKFFGVDQRALYHYQPQ